MMRKMGDAFNDCVGRGDTLGQTAGWDKQTPRKVSVNGAAKGGNTPCLKPCPFCAHQALRTVKKGRYYITCVHCHAQTKGYAGVQYAVTAWNKRRK